MTLRELPAVSRLLEHPTTARLLARVNRDLVVDACRSVLDDLRAAVRNGQPVDPAALEIDAIVGRVEARVTASRDSRLQRVVNATGTVLHTNLGRALLPQAAVDAVVTAATHPVTLEYDLARGERGRRDQGVEELLVALTGAEAATVVNNNAAAVLLALNTLANGRDVVVSRGELIEIGGAFRIPEIMARSGAVLREVGTTNRTHPADYEAAISDRTALLLKVHTSNYRIVGFVADVKLPELVALGRTRGIPVMEDLGSGALVDLSGFGLPQEPVVADRVARGADLVTFSGDKVLGGPQAGLIVGKASHVAKLRANPLHRALRCDKLTIAALEATLRLYRQSPDIVRDIPALRACARPLAEIEATATAAVEALRRAFGPEFRLSIERDTSQIGSGALPTEEIPTAVIVVQHDELSATRLAERFRQATPPIIGRIKSDRFLLDVRTIWDPADLVPHWTD
ncbi:MAG: L-seryl-tRNA(Sec) selenium transferase [Acidobacteria bacterium]|nr:L-seryl-tRNA(Sec) selenium transferase [Acidobacteriota bacterium]